MMAQVRKEVAAQVAKMPQPAPAPVIREVYHHLNPPAPRDPRGDTRGNISSFRAMNNSYWQAYTHGCISSSIRYGGISGMGY
jgi:hypothetical protein